MKKFLLTFLCSFLSIFALMESGSTSFLNVVNAQGEWTYNGIRTSQSLVHIVNTPIRITADVSGDTSGFQYKFVWQQNNWHPWEVIRDFESSPSCDWIPNRVGFYEIWVDVKDKDGKIVTKTIEINVKSSIWSFDSITFDKASPQIAKDSTIKIKANTSGDTAGLKYKFVWNKDNRWDADHWGVLRDFSSESTFDWRPQKAGNYGIYVDVQDKDGKIITRNVKYDIQAIWNYDSITFNKVSPQNAKESTIKITANTSGDTDGLQYKFVWIKDNNWHEGHWGVLRDFASESTFDWRPQEAGNYKIYVDVKDLNGKIITQTAYYKIKFPDAGGIIRVPYLNQDSIVYGCEAVSSTMLLNYYGYGISSKDFTDNYLIRKDWYYKNGQAYGPDPHAAFPGNPYVDSGVNCGYGSYAPCTAKSIDKILDTSKHKARFIMGSNLNNIVDTYVRYGTPVLIWATMDMRPSSPGDSWTINYVDENSPYRIGDRFTWKRNEHCLVLVGYDSSKYYFNDPYKNHGLIGYDKSLVEQRFNELGKQAVVICNQ